MCSKTQVSTLNSASNVTGVKCDLEGLPGAGGCVYTSAMSKRGGRRRTQGDGWELIQARQREAASVKRVHSEPIGDQKIDLRVEKRRDKLVTVARGFQLNAKDLKALGKMLKTKCASGGTTTEDAIEIQGRNDAKVNDLLVEAGYQVRIR